jgi:hypothetical protein
VSANDTQVGGLAWPPWHAAHPAERLAGAVGLGLMAVGAFHGLVFLVDGGAWQGPVSWRKPTTFGLSFGLTLATLAWVTTSLRLRDRVRWGLLTVLTVTMVVEVGLVAMQAWRDVPSHFNHTSSFDESVFSAMGASVAIIGITILAITVLAFTSADAPPATAWAVGAGLLALLVSQGIGAMMIGRGVAALAAGDQAEAYVAGGTLKLAHAVTLHGVQVLPLLAVVLATAVITERRRLGLVGLAVAGYVLVAGAAFLTPGGATTVPAAILLAVGVATLAVAGGQAVWLLVVTTGRLRHRVA